MILTKNKHIALFLGYVIASVIAMFGVVGTAHAAPEGCYYRQDIPNAGSQYTAEECPAGLNARLAEPEPFCFVTAVADATQADQYLLVDCTSFQANGAPGPNNPANTAPSTNPTGINDPNFSAGGEFASGGGEFDCTAQQLDAENCRIVYYLVVTINVLSAIAGMVIIGSIMMAGYQYMTARDNSGQIMKARLRIVWSLVALVLFVFMYALLNFLVPGGVL